MTGNNTVVILGGGTGGLVAARRLRWLLDPADRVVVVDQTADYLFAPSFLWVMNGTRRPGQVKAERARLRRAGIEIVQAEIHEIDVARRRVKTSEAEIAFDRLVIALGADLDPGAVPGFPGAAHNLYTLDGAAAAASALRGLEAGRVVVAVSRLPFKCPAAPYEAAFLAEALLRRRGLGDQVTVDVYTPEPFPMPTAGPVLGDALTGMLAQRGIGFHPGQVIERIDLQARELALAGGQRVGYDLLLGIPAHRAPEAAAASGLAGETGFLQADPATLATSAEGVYAIGDVTAIPLPGGKFLPKAGVFAEAQAKVAARNIAAELAGRRSAAAFDGHGACFVELGDRRAAFAAGNFYAPGSPQIRLRRPGPQWHLAKVAFEQYWLRRWARPHGPT
jgi:sulfide:quinone oxidoreductase